MNFFKEIGVIHESPSRQIQDQWVQSDDDLFILNTAIEFQAVVLSNDKYRQYVHHGDLAHVINFRLLQVTFIKDRLILPKDPLGSQGPTLDAFLRFPLNN